MFNFLQQIDGFTTTIATNTFSTNGNRNAVPEEWELEQPQRFDRVVKKLHGSAQQIVVMYETLVRTATCKLGMLPDQMVKQSANTP